MCRKTAMKSSLMIWILRTEPARIYVEASPEPVVGQGCGLVCRRQVLEVSQAVCEESMLSDHEPEKRSLHLEQPF